MKNLCPACMEPMTDSVCPVCGFDSKAENTAGGPLTNQLLKGRYQIGNLYTSNKASAVYLALDTESGAKVFVREFTGEALLEDSSMDKARLVDRFLKYQKSIASISLCKLFPRTVELFEEQENGYLVTEYFEGQSLRELLERGVKISGSNAFKIIEDLLSELKIMHNAHMIYGALAPDTLYLLKDGGIRLFGMGSPFYDFLEDLDQRAEYLNPSYAAPELFEKDGERGSYCDVYSAAALLYRISTNTIPPISFLRSGGESIKNPLHLNPDIKKTVATAMLNGLNWQRQMRPATTDAFLSQLTAARVTRSYSTAMLWSAILGFFQRLYDRRVIAANRKRANKGKTPKNKSLLWLWLTLGGIALVLSVILVLLLLLPRDAENKPSADSATSHDGWYYGSGTETPTDDDFYYSSKAPLAEDTQSDTSSQEYIDPDTVECPDLISYPLATAERLLTEADLFVGNIIYEYSNDYPVDFVIDQNIPVGTRVKKGQRVNLRVSKGSDPATSCEMPDVVGLELNEALTALSAEGFSEVDYSFVDSEEAAGRVLSANVTAGSVISTDTKLTLTVSGAPHTVKNFVGMSLAEAFAADPDIKFSTYSENGNKVTVFPAMYSSCKILSQAVEAGSEGYKGMTLKVTVDF